MLASAAISTAAEGELISVAGEFNESKNAAEQAPTADNIHDFLP